MGMRAARGLGQIFLVSPKNMDRIVEAARIEPDDVVLEIGTGLGRLAARLAARACAVVSVEIDERLCQAARARLAEFANVTLLCCDFLASKHRINPAVTAALLPCCGAAPRLGAVCFPESRRGCAAEARRSMLSREPAPRRAKVVSNLPYRISSPAIINMLEWEVPLAEIDVMVQSEVAQRLTARPGEAAYGPLTVSAAYHAEVEQLFSLPPSAFWPRPAVSSSFLRITPRLPERHAQSYRVFCEVVSKLLQSRRKTLAHALEIGWGHAKAKLVLGRVHSDPALRPGRLDVADFVRIADVLASDAPDTATQA